MSLTIWPSLEGMSFHPDFIHIYELWNLTDHSDYFGLDGDPFTQVPQNISSVVDLLEDKGISWSLYQEDLPYTGYQGFDWVNQKTGANDYVRKHK